MLRYDSFLYFSTKYWFLNKVSFLADCTNGRAYATALRLSSSVCLYGMTYFG